MFSILKLISDHISQRAKARKCLHLSTPPQIWYHQIGNFLFFFVISTRFVSFLDRRCFFLVSMATSYVFVLNKLTKITLVVCFYYSAWQFLVPWLICMADLIKVLQHWFFSISCCYGSSFTNIFINFINLLWYLWLSSFYNTVK